MKSENKSINKSINKYIVLLVLYFKLFVVCALHAYSLLGCLSAKNWSLG